LGQPLSERALPESADTEQLGAALARSLRWSASGPLTVYLQGELGSGKTTLARGLMRELGVSDPVRSPTYTLLESYELAARRVLHLDLYRLSGAAELAPLGLRDELGPDVLLIVEWPERGARGLPGPDLRVTLTVTASGRRARLESGSPAGASWLASVLMPSTPELKRV
jgi:tRNA threonylcarbamoyladenosine biosynthesis protein TsaE